MTNIGPKIAFIDEEQADPWYLAIFTSWWDDWIYGGDRDLNGDLRIDSVEAGNRKDGSLSRELDTIVRNVGLDRMSIQHYPSRLLSVFNINLCVINPPDKTPLLNVIQLSNFTHLSLKMVCLRVC